MEWPASVQKQTGVSRPNRTVWVYFPSRRIDAPSAQNFLSRYS